MTAPVPITLLTQPACGLCDVAKEHPRPPRRALSAVGDRDRASTRRQGRRLAAQAGVMFAPGVLVDGQPFSYGRLSERKLRRLLDRRTTSSSIASKDSHCSAHAATTNGSVEPAADAAQW